MGVNMKKMIKIEVYHDGEFYCAKCPDYDIFSQGKSLDELIENIKEAIVLHFENEHWDLEGYDRSPSLLSIMDLGEIHV